MLLLSRTDVRALLSMRDALDAVREGFRQLHEGGVHMPQRLALTVPGSHSQNDIRNDGLHLSMPALVEGAAGGLAIKIVTVYPQNPTRVGQPSVQGVVLLHDATTGAPLALMDAEELTRLRTAAASGVATALLARTAAATLLMIGTGALAPAHIEAICAVRPIRSVLVHSATGARDQQLCAWVRDHLGVEAQPAHTLREAVERADVICTATNAASPLFAAQWLAPGTHINAVGAYTKTLREVDAATVSMARVIVDQVEAAKAEAGDIVQAARDLGVEPESLIAGELGAVIAGATPGRQNNEEITLFKSVGLAMQDTVTAAKVYAAALKQGIGTQIDLTK